MNFLRFIFKAREKEIQRDSSNCWFTPETPATACAGPGQSQEPGTQVFQVGNKDKRTLTITCSLSGCPLAGT